MKELTDELRPITNILKPDSPNNAMDTSLPSAILQKRSVEVAEGLLSR